MPLADYMLIHPTARLTDAEKQALIQGLQKSLGQ
jgi:Haem-binding domain